MGKLKDEILKIDVVVNGNKAQKELYKLDEANRSIAQTQKDLRSEKIKLLAAGKKESDQYKTITSQIRTNNKTIKDNKSRMGELRKEIGVTSLTSKQLVKYQKELQNAFNNTVPGSKKYTEYSNELKKVNAQVLKLKQQSKGTGSVLGGLTSKLGGVSSSLIGLAGIGSVVALGKQVYDTSKQFRELQLETKLLTDLQGNLLDKAVAGTKALSQTYGTEYQENLIAANATAEAYGTTYAKVLAEMENGYLAGANASGDMLDQLEEYAPLMKEANVPLEGMISLMAQANKDGVFGDKAIDSLKEGLLSIREGSDATRTAMTKLGLDTDDIYKQLQAGNISYFDVMQKVSGKLNELSDQSPEVGEAMANIFKGAGEDASLDYLRSLETVNLELDDLIDNTDELIQLKKEETRINTELNNTWVKTTETGGLMNQMYLQLKGQLASVLTDLNDTYLATARLKEITGRGYWSGLMNPDYKGLGNWVITLTKLREEAEASDIPLNSLSGHLENINLKLQEEQSKLTKYANATGKTEKIKYQQAKAASEDRIKILQDEANKTKALLLEIQKEENLTKEENLKTRTALEKRASELSISYKKETTDKQLQNLITEKNRELAIIKEAAKKEADAKELAYKKALSTIDGFIQKQTQEKIDYGKASLEKEITNIQQSYSTKIELAKKHGIDTADLENLQAEAIIQAKLEQKQKEADALKAFDEELRISKIETDAENKALDAETDEERTLILLQKTRDIANAQIEIEREKQLEILRLNGASSKQIADMQALYDGKKQTTDKNYNKAVQEQTKKTTKAKQQLLADELGATATFFNGVGQMLGKNTKAGKVAAAAQATVNTWQGVTQIWKNETTLPEPFGTLQKVGATGMALASGLNAVKNINSTSDNVTGYEKGKYPITRTDGKVFNSKIGGAATTQLVTEPTYFPQENFLAGEQGPSMPELIVDGPTFKVLRPEVKEEIYATHRRVRGYESGNIAQVASKTTSEPENGTDIENVVSRNTQAINHLITVIEDGISVDMNFGYDHLKKLKQMQDKVSAAKSKATLAS